MLTSDQVLDKIAADIKAWDGDDLNMLLPAVNRLQKLREYSYPDRLPQGEEDYKKDIDAEKGIRMTFCRDYTDDQASHALYAAAERSDLVWPSPWDEESCEFAWIVDRKGQFLTREDSRSGDWFLNRWQPGVNCMFNADSED